MGKSIRSKSKLKAKSAKRAGEFTKFVDERNKRISDKLAKAKLTKADEPVEDKMDEDESTEKTKSKEEVTVSTSGWKTSRKSLYKQSKLKNKKKKTHMKF